MDPDPDPIRIQGFNDQKLKKNTAEKKIYIFFYQKLQFTVYLSLGLHKEPPCYRRSQKRPSITSKHEL